MATYKVIQDVEAEDHIIGPLTLRQFIFALIALFFFYVCFLLVSKGVAFLVIVFLPPGLFFGFFAIPFGRDQPTEIWVLAKIRYYFKPRKRIWDQSGIKELVTITVPKKIEQQYTDGLNQTEVKSRLSLLAKTLDSRGWTIKNQGVTPTYYSQSSSYENTSDRLVNVDNYNEQSQDDYDIEDTNSQVYRQFDRLINELSRAKHQALINNMNSQDSSSTSASNSSGVDDQWFMPQSQPPDEDKKLVYAPKNEVAEVSAADDEVLDQIRLKQTGRNLSQRNLRTLKPMDFKEQSKSLKANTNETNKVAGVDQISNKDLPSADIISLATNNDLSVDTIAHLAKKVEDTDEVVISLHQK